MREQFTDFYLLTRNRVLNQITPFKLDRNGLVSFCRSVNYRTGPSRNVVRRSAA